MIFSPIVVNHTLPQVSVVNADSGVPAITYNQIKSSLGNQIYNVEEFYLYASSLNQIIGTIQYNRFDAVGNQEAFSIATVADPYQITNALYKKIEGYETMVIFNGNSSVSTTILANTSLQIKFISKRITNSFGRNLNNFRDLEKIFKPNFFNNYGASIEDIQKTNEQIEENISFVGADGTTEDKIKLYKEKNQITALFGIILGVIGVILIRKKIK
jgi:hypothetical protein